jgi:asparagine synthase (glutamine-hydrolysing)
MAASLEGRVPFLDYRLVEWSYKLRSNLKIKGLANKWIVRKAARKWLPKEIVRRKKVGFDVLVGHWLRNRKGLGANLELLCDGTFRTRGYFNASTVDLLVQEHLRGRSDHTEILWGLVTFEIWCRRFMDSTIKELSVRPTATN